MNKAEIKIYNKKTYVQSTKDYVYGVSIAGAKLYKDFESVEYAEKWVNKNIFGDKRLVVEAECDCIRGYWAYFHSKGRASSILKG